MIKSIKHARADKTKFKYTIDFRRLTDLPSDLVGNVVQLHWSRGDHKGESKGYRVQKKERKTPGNSPTTERRDHVVSFAATTPSSSSTATAVLNASNASTTSDQTTPPPPTPSTAAETSTTTSPITSTETASTTTTTTIPVASQSPPPTPAVEVTKDTTLTRKQAKLLIGNCIDGDNNLPSGNGYVVMNEKMAIPVTLYSSSSHQELPAPFEQKLLTITLLLGQLTLATVSVDLALHYQDNGREVISIPFPSSSSVQPTLMLSLKAKCKDKEKKQILLKSNNTNISNGAGGHVNHNMLNPHYHPTAINLNNHNNNNNNTSHSHSHSHHHHSLHNNNNNTNNTTTTTNSTNPLMDNNNNIPNITIVNPTGIDISNQPSSLQQQDCDTLTSGSLVRDPTTESLITSTWSSDDDSSDDTFHINEKELARKTLEIRALTSKLIQCESHVQETAKVIQQKDNDILTMIKKVEQAQTAVLEYEESAHRSKVMEEYANRKMISLSQALESQKKLQHFESTHHLIATVPGDSSHQPHVPLLEKSLEQRIMESLELNERQEAQIKENEQLLEKKESELELLQQTIEELTEQMELKNKEIEQVVEGSKQYFETQLGKKDEKIKKLKESLETVIRESNHKDIELIEREKQQEKLRLANPQPSSSQSTAQSLLWNPIVAWSFALFCFMMFYLKSQDC